MPLPLTMNAVVRAGHGGLDTLDWREDDPLPRPGTAEVLVRGRGRAGGGPIRFPRFQGADCCGPCTGPSAVPKPRLKPSGRNATAVLPKSTTIHTAHGLRIDSPLWDVELASFPCAFFTAEAMIRRAALTAERVVIAGVSGGVGSAAVQLGRRRGAHVTAVTRAQKADAVLARGADLPGQSFDVLLGLLLGLRGGPGWSRLPAALVPQGRYVTSGAIAGPTVDLDLRTLCLSDPAPIGSTRHPSLPI